MRRINKFLSCQPGKVLSSHRAEGRHTPDPTLASQAWVLHRPALSGVPAQPPGPDCANGLSRAGKSCSSGPGPAPAPTGKVSSADRQPRGGVRATSLGSPRGPRDLRPRSLRGLLRGFPGAGPRASSTSPAPVAQGSAPAPHVPYPRGPCRTPSPKHEPRGLSGLPSARPAPPEPGVLHSGQAGRGRRP